MKNVFPSGVRVRRRAPSWIPDAPEALEGRALLSHAAVAHPRLKVVADVQPPPAIPDAHPGPILNMIGVGFAYKSPRLYPYASTVTTVHNPVGGTGGINGRSVLIKTVRSELNGAGARAYLDGQGNAVFVGIVVGPINATPSTPDRSEYYLWGIDRGLTTGVGPFPRRPNIRFDAVVAVAITPVGTGGVVRDLVTGATTPISADRIVVDADDVKIAVPQSLLIPAGTALTTIPTVNFFPSTTLQARNHHDVVSFTPEFRNFPISLHPIPHKGVHH